MSKIERGQFSSALRRYLGMTGVSDVLDELAPEISASLTLEGERPEWEFLKSQKLMSGNTLVAGVAVKKGVYRLRNPTDSGVVAIFESIFMSSELSVQFQLTREETTTDLATLEATIARDTRYPAVAASALSVTSEAVAAPTGSSFHTHFNFSAGPVVEFRVPIVLTPGHALQVICNTVNTAFYVSAHWLEKRLDALERS